MKHSGSLFLLILVLTGCVAAPVPQRYAKILDDLPLMQGLEPVQEKDLIVLFGPNTLAETTAKGMVDVDSVYMYYQATLPQMGWAKENARTFDRDRDRLTIDAKSSNNDGVTIVKFSLSPLSP